MNEIDLLLGYDVCFEDIGKIKSLKIKDIRDMGFDIYSQNIGIICITEDDIFEMFDYELEQDIPSFDFIYHNCLHGNEDMKNQVLDSFKMIFGVDSGVNEDGFYIGSKDNVINKDNFKSFTDLVKKQNCVQPKKILRPKNEAQKKYMKQRKKIRQQRGESKSDIPDIISAVCAKHNSYNLFNIGELTMYQLIDQYKRLCSIEEYFINFQSLMHGASGDNIKIKHWSEPMV